jgi:hypothetical protein
VRVPAAAEAAFELEAAVLAAEQVMTQTHGRTVGKGYDSRPPGVRCLVSGAGCPVPGVRCRVSAAERRAPSAERRAPSAERRTPNAERRTPNAERRTPNAERRTPNASCLCARRAFVSMLR